MKQKLTTKTIIFSLLFTIVLSGVLYKDSFTSYFFQDDWFSFRISLAQSFRDILSFFIPRVDVIYYRPFGMQIPFFILGSLFGVNPSPFRVISFITHAVNIILVFILIKKLTKTDSIALLASFFYGVSSVHYIPFYWFATYAFISGPTMFFASTILFLLFIQQRRKTCYLFSIIFFIAGILTNELVFTMPLIMFCYLIIFRRINFIKYLTPHFIVILASFAVRFFIFRPPSTGYYQLGLYSLMNNLEGYLLWSFNWPEEMKAQLIKFYKVNPQFIRDFPFYYYIFISTFLFFIILLIICLIINFLKNKEKYKLNFIVFGLVWYLIGLFPVIFFPHHAFAYYLPISLVGLLLILTTLFSELIKIFDRKSKYFAYIVVVSIIISWLLTSFVTMEFNSKVHWAPRRAKLARGLIKIAIQTYHDQSGLLKQIQIEDTSENRLALNEQDGLKVIIGDDGWETVYIH